jgi:hypothetical protein
MSDIEKEFVDGYLDGRDKDSPEPNNNRHPAYKHSFNVGRAELRNEILPAHISRARAKLIKDNYNDAR